MPLERILLETDAPYFTPWTEDRNSALPGDVAHVAGQVAALKGVSIQEVRSGPCHLHCIRC